MQATATRDVTAAEIEAYHRDGVVYLPGIIDGSSLEKALSAAIEMMNKDEQSPLAMDLSTAGEPGRYYAISFMWRINEVFRSLALDSPLGDISAQLLKCEEVRFFYDQLFIKEPGTSSRTKWHQDIPFWPMQGNDILSLWLALTPVSRKSSAVEYIAGSHKWGKRYRAEFSDNTNPTLARISSDDLEACPDFDQLRNNPKYKFLSWDLLPGDIVVHHPSTVHGAAGNLEGDQLRVGVSNRYMGPDVTWDPRPSAMYIEGNPKLEVGAAPIDESCFPTIRRRSGR